MSDNSLMLDRPVFIGGTGRSGTSILSNMLDRHSAFFTTMHENKLIVETGGLRTLVDTLGGSGDTLARHHAIHDFLTLAEIIRKKGFRSRLLRLLGKSVNHQALLKFIPNAQYSIHAIGHRFGLAHYDTALKRFNDKIVHSVSHVSTLDTRGIYNTYFIAKQLTRVKMLALARGYLNDLYTKPLLDVGAVRWSDDSPLNICHAGFLSELYPQMKLIHIARDPRDLIASYKSQIWSPGGFDEALHITSGVIDHWLDARQVLPEGSYLEIRLEDLVDFPSATMSTICKFLGVPFEHSVLDIDLSKSNKIRYLVDLTPEQIENIERRFFTWMQEKQYL